MSQGKKERAKNRKLDNDMWLEILAKTNPTEIDSWQEENFSYTFLRLGNRINVTSRYFLKATNLNTKEERVIRIPASISTGREALNWATAVSK